MDVSYEQNSYTKSMDEIIQDYSLMRLEGIMGQIEIFFNKENDRLLAIVDYPSENDIKSVLNNWCKILNDIGTMDNSRFEKYTQRNSEGLNLWIGEIIKRINKNRDDSIKMNDDEKKAILGVSFFSVLLDLAGVAIQ